MLWKVFVTTPVAQPAIDKLKDYGFDVEIYEDRESLSEKQLIEKIKSCDAILPMLTNIFSKEVLDNAGKLKIIANHAVGFNNIDLKAASEKKIAITNTPGVLTEATADLTMALLMAVAKRIVEGDKLTRRGEFTGWGPLMLLGAEITGKTLGIIGAGRIGAAVAKRSNGFDMQILYTDNQKNEQMESDLKAKKVELDFLIKESDYVTLHIPLNDNTFHLINKARLQKMKSNAYLINTSRGPVVDEEALVEALQNRWIAGAGLDVYENEPEIADGLIERENVVLLPHIGSATLETRTKMAMMAVDNIIALYEGKKPPNLVNIDVM